MQGRIEAEKAVSQYRLALSRFLSNYPFPSARTIAADFGVACNSVKIILARESGLKKILKAILARSAD
jgi:hypothetical protein